MSLCADTFGRERVGVVFGWIFASHQIGAAVAGVTAGLPHDWLGGYTIAFIGGGALCLVAAGLALRIPRRRATLAAVSA